MKIQSSPHGGLQSQARAAEQITSMYYCALGDSSLQHILLEPHAYKCLQRRAGACPLRNKHRNRTSCANIGVQHPV